MFFDTYSQLCKQKGVSCKKAAMDIGCSGATATRWKNGSIPNGETLKKLAIYFGVTAEYLLNGDEIKKDPTNSGEVDNDIEDILETFRTRPEMKMLFAVSKKHSKEDVENFAKFLEGLGGNNAD